MHKLNLGISEKEVANRAKLGIISTKTAEKGENMSEDGQKKFISKLTDALEEGRKKGTEQGFDLAHTKLVRRRIIAERVKESRKRAKLTQEEMSSKINTNTLSYRGYENCKNDFPIEYLVRIADTLNVSMDYLTGRTDDPTNRGEDSTNLAERIEQLEKAVAGLKNG